MEGALPREIITVLGPIAPEAMGVAQTHEHLLIDAMDHYGGYQFVIDDEELVVEELSAFSSRGVQTICDPTVDEIGRHPQALARISRAAGIHSATHSRWGS